jgi:hypothetical protein
LELSEKAIMIDLCRNIDDSRHGWSPALFIHRARNPSRREGCRALRFLAKAERLGTCMNIIPMKAGMD